MVWLMLSKERLHGVGKKLKPIRYGPFKIFKKIGDNAFQLELPPYMQMYSVINAEYLKPFEPSLLDDDEDVKDSRLPPLDDLWFEREDPMTADCILEKKITTTRHGQIESYRIRRKCQFPSKSKWFRKEKGIQEFPHLQF
ncbi:uncharacterized protein LOC112203956 [Rosa chinensis]|uniref:uncharacterized protein LOC112203956 n=1 Tax=Rosa chinensis TaxID=74649 RepID=UPI000D08E1BF|nr:uncharacterized protein LOC112203956 [Rosa chinensis]